MAGGARNIGVPVGEQETRGAVVELGVQPVIERNVAGLTGGGEFRGDVIWIRGLLKILLVAGDARRRKSHVVSDRRILMAFLAFDHGVRAE